MLERRRDVHLRVFTVWEPILATDLTPPISAVLERMPDLRVRQYWDPNHLVAKQLASDARPPQQKEACCVKDGILWDLVAIYPKGALWTERMPPASLFNGTVVDVIHDVDTELQRTGVQEPRH